MTTIRYSCEVFKCSPLAKFSYFLALISVCAVGLVGCGSDEPAVATAEAPEDWKSLDWSPLAEEIESRALREGSGSNPVGRRFQKLGPEDTGIEFHNQLDRENIKNYLLSGAGLAVGDVDGNGLPDLFLVSQDGAAARNLLLFCSCPCGVVPATLPDPPRAATRAYSEQSDLATQVCSSGTIPL